MLLTACRPLAYEPVAPHHQASDGLNVELTKLDTSSPAVAVFVSADVEGDRGTAIKRVLLAPAAAEPCHEGIRALRIVIDDKAPWLRPIEVEGKHALRAQFAPGGAHELLGAETAVDFVLAAPDGERCVRVPLSGSDPALAWTADPHFFGGMGVRAYSPVGSVGGVGAAWTLEDSLGTDIGPLRLQGELGIGGANCRHDCGNSDLGFVLVPLAASAHLFLFDTKGAALDLGLRYRWILSSVGSSDQSRSFTLRSPEISLRFAGTANEGPGLPHGHRIASAGFEVFGGDWRYSGPNGVESSFVLGIGVCWDHGF
jgi:hypothetical protein